MADDHTKSPEAFLRKMDSGQLDGNLGTEIRKLSPEHLDEVARRLMERDAVKRQSSTSGNQDEQTPPEDSQAD